MCALAIYDAWLAQKELAPDTVSDIEGYDWDLMDRIASENRLQ
jgi:hypothetical protein